MSTSRTAFSQCKSSTYKGTYSITKKAFALFAQEEVLPSRPKCSRSPLGDKD